LVLTIAFLDPVRERVRALLGQGPERRDPAYRRLRRALGDELLTSQRPEAAIGPAVGHLCRALHIRCAAVVAADGRTIAAYGPAPPEGAAVAVTLPLRAGPREFGQFVLGPKRLKLPYGEADLDLLGEVASFIAASLLFAERQSAQAAALDVLSQEPAALQSQEEALAAALVD